MPEETTKRILEELGLQDDMKSWTTEQLQQFLDAAHREIDRRQVELLKKNKEELMKRRAQ